MMILCTDRKLKSTCTDSYKRNTKDKEKKICTDDNAQPIFFKKNKTKKETKITKGKVDKQKKNGNKQTKVEEEKKAENKEVKKKKREEKNPGHIQKGDQKKLKQC